MVPQAPQNNAPKSYSQYTRKVTATFMLVTDVVDNEPWWRKIVTNNGCYLVWISNFESDFKWYITTLKWSVVPYKNYEQNLRTVFSSINLFV